MEKNGLQWQIQDLEEGGTHTYFHPLMAFFIKYLYKYISEIYICNIEHNRFNLTS